MPALGDTTAPCDLQEAADYYLTPRGQHPNAPNKMLTFFDGEGVGRAMRKLAPFFKTNL